MKTLFILSLVFVLAASQDERHSRVDESPRQLSTTTMSPPVCIRDPFYVVPRCHVECIVRRESRCIDCNRNCNERLNDQDSRCPDIRRCTLGCSLSRDDDTGCPVCDCEDPDDEPVDGIGPNPCRVNATGFITLFSCQPDCVSRTDEGCFMCDRACSDNRNTTVLSNQCGAPGIECDDDSVCVLEGIVNRCVEMPGNGDACDRVDSAVVDEDGEDEDEEEEEEPDVRRRGFLSRIEGAVDRLRVFALRSVSEMAVPCLEGSICSRQLGQCVEVSGPCTDAGRNGTATCDDKGNFEPLQCRRMDDGTHSCHCVYPQNGTTVAGSMRTGIRHKRDVPDCESRVFRFCKYKRNRRHFIVHHGQKFVNHETCLRCRCNDGNATACQRDHQVNCRILNPGSATQACSHRGRTIPHGTRRKIGKCNMCGCNNGRLTCTDIEECRDKNDERDENERRCEKCQQVPPMLVCGRDGRTHHSRCIAMNCSGLGENDVLDGPCSNQPVCSLYPCRDGLACIPLGGRSCLRNEGCTADERRMCVNRTALKCRVSNTNRDGFITDEEDEMVCGSDRRTYRSFCHLIQQAPANTKVAHAGPCENQECNRGQVCGTDGVTYNSTCHLRTQSANAQVDYRGECVEGGEMSLREICRSVRKELGRCEETRHTCKHRVLSRDGCCPICGGITTLAIDKEALDEYSRATNSDTNLDEFMARLTRDDVIPEDVRNRCRVEVTHIRNSTQTNIEVKIIAKDRSADSNFCHDSSKDFADRINDATSTSNTTTTDSIITTSVLPVEASFASAAAVAPLIVDTDENSNNNGAVNHMAMSTYTCLVALLTGTALKAVMF